MFTYYKTETLILDFFYEAFWFLQKILQKHNDRKTKDERLYFREILVKRMLVCIYNNNFISIYVAKNQ